MHAIEISNCFHGSNTHLSQAEESRTDAPSALVHAWWTTVIT